ncbi:MAG TPA: hypothetical protein VFT37_09820 [Telluria sp.]|nr:hypothetical protein [Telluria sp.]
MRTLFAALAISLIATSCGGGAGIGSSSGGGNAGAGSLLNVQVAGSAMSKVRPTQQGWVGMAETLRRLTDYTAPDRHLVLSADGAGGSGQWSPPAGWSLIDFAVHPSGHISAVLANQVSIRLVRLSATGAVLAESDFTDPAALTDPYIGDEIYLRNPNALVPHATRDAVRIAPVGEQLAMVLRTGRNAVVAYRLVHGAAGYQASWRTLVEPGVAIGSVFITGGTFDPFSGLENQWRLAMDVDARGRIAVAVLMNRTELAAGHAQHFGEPVSPNVVHGAILTVVAENGQRSPSTVIDTGRRPEIHAVKWLGDKVAVGGRVFTESRADGTGWDGLVAVADPYLRTLRPIQLLDVDRGDVVFDFAAAPGGQLLAVGSTGYVQNPAGASISEDAAPMAALLDADGKFVRRIPMVSAPRHNQVRSVFAWKDGRWLAAGMQEGPGTHTGDDNLALIKANGFVRDFRADQ